MMHLAPAKATFSLVAVHLALLLVTITIAHAAEEDFEESGVGVHGVDLWISVTRPYGSLTDLADDARPGSGPSLGIDLRLSPNTHSTMLLVTAGVHALMFSRPSAAGDGPDRLVSGLWTVARLGVKTRHTIAAPVAGRTILIASVGIAQPGWVRRPHTAKGTAKVRSLRIRR